MTEQITNISHELKMLDRSILNISGVNKIISFDSNEFLLQTIMGPLHIKGDKLELLSLDTTGGNIKIKGSIKGLNYIDKVTKTKEESFLSKLFK